LYVIPQKKNKLKKLELEDITNLGDTIPPLPLESIIQEANPTTITETENKTEETTVIEKQEEESKKELQLSDPEKKEIRQRIKKKYIQNTIDLNRAPGKGKGVGKGKIDVLLLLLLFLFYYLIFVLILKVLVICHQI
jgi:hypothetical protein